MTRYGTEHMNVDRYLSRLAGNRTVTIPDSGLEKMSKISAAALSTSLRVVQAGSYREVARLYTSLSQGTRYEDPDLARLLRAVGRAYRRTDVGHIDRNAVLNYYKAGGHETLAGRLVIVAAYDDATRGGFSHVARAIMPGRGGKFRNYVLALAKESGAPRYVAGLAATAAAYGTVLGTAAKVPRRGPVDTLAAGLGGALMDVWEDVTGEKGGMRYVERLKAARACAECGVQIGLEKIDIEEGVARGTILGTLGTLALDELGRHFGEVVRPQTHQPAAVSLKRQDLL